MIFLQVTLPMKKDAHKSALVFIFSAILFIFSNYIFLEQYSYWIKSFEVEGDQGNSLASFKHSKHVGPGFYNSGNSCYINASIQCLLHSKPFYSFIHSTPCHTTEASKKWCTLCQLKTLLLKCDSIKDNRLIYPYTSYAIPNPFGPNINQVYRNFKVGDMDDSASMITELFRNIEEILIPRNITLSITGVMSQIRGTLSCPLCLKTTDKNSDHKFLPISIKNPINGLNLRSISQAFELYFTPEEVEYRDLCSDLNLKIKKMVIGILPEVLILQLNRFSNASQKLTHDVSFSLQLDMRRYCVPNMDDTSFELTSVLVHRGASTKTGHYYSYVKVEDGTWWHMNDSSVNPVTPEIVLQQQAYILFYTRLHQRT